MQGVCRGGGCHSVHVDVFANEVKWDFEMWISVWDSKDILSTVRSKIGEKEVGI